MKNIIKICLLFAFGIYSPMSFGQVDMCDQVNNRGGEIPTHTHDPDPGRPIPPADPPVDPPTDPNEDPKIVYWVHGFGGDDYK